MAPRRESGPEDARRFAEVVALLSQRAVRWWALAVVVNRLSAAMAAIALILAAEAVTGSLADGALLVAGGSVGFAAAAPWRGRRLDRMELRSGLQRDCVLAAGTIAVLAVAVAVEAPLIVLIVLSIVAGAAPAGLEGGFRALLVSVVQARDVPRANALEAVLGELSFLVGPALAGALAFMAGPVTVLMVMAGTSLAAALAATRLPTQRPTSRPVRRRGGWRRLGPTPAVWRVEGVPGVYVLAVVGGACIGTFEAAMPPRVELMSLPAAAAGGYLTAAYVGSLIGGLVTTVTASNDVNAGAETGPWLAGGLFAWLGIGFAAMAAADSRAALLTAVATTGMALAPLSAIGTLMLQSRLPLHRQTEGFSVFIAAQALGAGIGSAATSQLLQRLGAPGSMTLVGALSLVAGMVVIVIGLRSERKTN